jgi:hypothetical protein
MDVNFSASFVSVSNGEHLMGRILIASFKPNLKSHNFKSPNSLMSHEA